MSETITLCNKKLEGKVAIITGGASGIGEATAHLFANHGARIVVIADVQDELGRNVAKSIGSHQCNYIHCDVADEEQVKSLVEWTVINYGQLDIIFSNAGVTSLSDQTVLQLDFSKFDHVMSINARGMAACLKHAARAMVERRVRGSIICTASMLASEGFVNCTDYCMSKHAVLGLVRCASKELGAYGIRANCVSPGPVATPILCKSLRMCVEEVEKVFEPMTCLKLGSLVKAEHVADAVLFLASDDFMFITGQDLVIAGGYKV